MQGWQLAKVEGIGHDVRDMQPVLKYEVMLERTRTVRPRSNPHSYLLTEEATFDLYVEYAPDGSEARDAQAGNPRGWSQAFALGDSVAAWLSVALAAEPKEDAPAVWAGRRVALR